ncbi:MAG: hypothetical protein CL764_06520 [Chloroflexi bacterium]|nr:hypothetical protein [Chloroflexota bacterium]
MIISIVFGIIISSVMSLITIGHFSIAMISDRSFFQILVNKKIKSNKFVLLVLFIHLLHLICGFVLSILFHLVSGNLLQILFTVFLFSLGIITSYLFRFLWKHIIIQMILFIIGYIWIMPMLPLWI